MKKIDVVIHPVDLNRLTERLRLIGVCGMTVAGARGLRAMPGTAIYRGQTYAVDSADELRVQIIVRDRWVDAVVSAARLITESGRTGSATIFVESVEEAIRIRTGERGDDAL